MLDFNPEDLEFLGTVLAVVIGCAIVLGLLANVGKGKRP